MKNALLILSFAISAVGLSACKPAQVVPIVVPGPSGPSGPSGQQGEPGKPGGGDTVIVVPPAMPASPPASSTYSLTKPARSAP